MHHKSCFFDIKSTYEGNVWSQSNNTRTVNYMVFSRYIYSSRKYGYKIHGKKDLRHFWLGLFHLRSSGGGGLETKNKNVRGGVRKENDSYPGNLSPVMWESESGFGSVSESKVLGLSLTC